MRRRGLFAALSAVRSKSTSVSRPGLLEGVYADALAIELEWAQLRFRREYEIAIIYAAIACGRIGSVWWSKDKCWSS